MFIMRNLFRATVLLMGLSMFGACINTSTGELEYRQACYRENCSNAQANCVVGSALFASFFSECSNWHNQSKSNRDNFFLKLTCDPAYVMASCGSAQQFCIDACNEENPI